MDSEDDMFPVIDAKSLSDDSNGNNIGGCGDDTDNYDTDDNSASCDQQPYKVLNEDDIRQRQDDDIVSISLVLSVTRTASSILLRHYNWSVSAVHEAWFADEDGVREAVGLLKNPIFRFRSKRKLTCGICLEKRPADLMKNAGCGHLFCSTCWGTYISTSIGDGPDMIDMMVSDEDKRKYSRYLLRSYVEGSRKIKWCPGPGCDYAVEYDLGSGNYDVSCLCSYSFCWNCIEEAHRPLDCDTVAKWIAKNNSEAENTNWILAFTKPCPKCKRPIEKNHGCMHMTCRAPCGFEFCWVCLRKYPTCQASCNQYRENKGDDDEAATRMKAKNYIQRYTHYYERWATNKSSRQKALADLHLTQTLHIDKLGIKQAQSRAELKFLIEAWLQIVECRRVLSWSYAYGYYIPEHEHAKRQLFEYLQGDAEAGLERLHQCAEKELQPFLDAEGPSDDFNNFRKKLAGLTSVTRNFFENLVRAFENGLSDVDSQGACSKPQDQKAKHHQ
ncbi:unnamed protein product [Ilex paraguariensis]|uniref:RBR-type E3 ubiquitin transferase n=1 Tax=Ilex paraguariensis TaxID=185542 RepID=A0ABC8UMP7_9AQUA